MKSLINRRASKKTTSWFKTQGRSSSSLPQLGGKAICPNFIAEKDNGYPLCDNPTCFRRQECGLSVCLPGPF